MPSTTNEPDRIPVSILTGFLGSGKTTLLSKLMHHPEMERIAVIVNEFGEVGLDDALVMEANEEVVLLNSGCLCCTVRGDLVDTLKTLFKDRAKSKIPNFDRIVIETTGLADPAPILHTMMADPFLMTRFRLDGVITVVDAFHAMTQFDQQFESVKQAAVADRIVLTKTDVTDADAVAAVENRLHEVNPAAPVITALQETSHRQSFSMPDFIIRRPRARMWASGYAKKPTERRKAMCIIMTIITIAMITHMDIITMMSADMTIIFIPLCSTTTSLSNGTDRQCFGYYGPNPRGEHPPHQRVVKP